MVRKYGKATRSLAACAMASLLAACGGGGSDPADADGPYTAPASSLTRPIQPPVDPDGPVAPGVPVTPTAPEPPAPDPDTVLAPSSTLAARCAAPRSGIDPKTQAPFVDVGGSLELEKRWVRSWIDETYLWFDEVPTGLRASDFVGPVDFFHALKTPGSTASGQPKDRFHFTLDTAAWDAQLQGGQAASYGMELAFIADRPPREVRVAYVEPGSPAANAGIGRGARILTVDGLDVAHGADVNALNSGLFPRFAGESHTFTFGMRDGSTRVVSLGAVLLTRASVQNTQIIPTATGPVGYLQFNEHDMPAEAQLIAAIEQIKAGGATDLVLDMRYNGGGLLDVASELAYMVATPQATSGTIFEKTVFNRKNPFGYTDEQMTLRFHDRAVGFSATRNSPLPQLGLNRVTVLAGPDTCSASEALVNGLRGVGITVNVVGGTTCGKPYGFTPKDNCGTTYFAIQFKGVNQQGFGDYDDGFPPNCAVADDFDHELGDPAEARLAAALTLRSSGICPTAPTSRSSVLRQKAAPVEKPYLRKPPSRVNRLIDFRATGKS